MTKSASASSVDPAVELELIQWRQARFKRITEHVEDSLPDLMARIVEVVQAMPSIAVSKAQILPDRLWKDSFEPWAQETARSVEADMDKEIDVLVASLFEKGSLQDALQVALPAFAGAGVLAASLAAIPSVIFFATVVTQGFFFSTSTVISWPLLAVGGAGLAVATYNGGRLADRLADRNRTRLIARLQGRARVAALGHGRASGERSLVTDLQAATLRSLEAKLENA